MHAAEDNHITLRALRRAGQGEGVPHKVRNVLDFRPLIAVRQNDGVALLLESGNFCNKVPV